MAESADQVDAWTGLAKHEPSFCTASLTDLSGQTARKVARLAERSQTQSTTPIQRGETRQEIGKICLFGCLNSIVKVQIGAEIFLSGYLLSKVENLGM